MLPSAKDVVLGRPLILHASLALAHKRRWRCGCGWVIIRIAGGRLIYHIAWVDTPRVALGDGGQRFSCTLITVVYFDTAAHCYSPSSLSGRVPYAVAVCVLLFRFSVVGAYADRLHACLAVFSHVAPKRVHITVHLVSRDLKHAPTPHTSQRIDMT